MIATSINIEDPLAYELLSRVIDEFEKSAINTGKKEAFLAVANGPLTAMETILNSSESALTKVDRTRNLVKDDGSGEKLTPKKVIGESGIQFDEDLLEIFDSEKNPGENYIEDCWGCKLRLTMDWQLKPLALLDGFNSMIDEINAVLDRFLNRIDPFNILQDICSLLNEFSIFCPPDLIMILMALKLLMKKYLMGLLQVRFDWTVLLGPLLKWIIDAISSLLEQLVRIMVAPLDCILGALRTANDTWKELNNFLGSASAFGASLDKGNFGVPTNIDANITKRDAKWISEEEGFGLKNPQELGRLQTADRFRAQDQLEGSVSFTTGFNINGDMTLVDAFNDPLFEQATFLEKWIVAVQEARSWITGLFDNILEALGSLNALVGGGLGLSLDQLGILSFIADMIGLIMMIIRLMKMKLNIKDWCSTLEENPELLERELRERYGDQVNIKHLGNRHTTDTGAGPASHTTGLVVSLGPDIVGVIQTCSSHRSQVDQQSINRWIAELER